MATLFFYLLPSPHVKHAISFGFATFDCCGEQEGGGSRGRGRAAAAAAAITTTNENSGDKDKSQQWVISGT